MDRQRDCYWTVQKNEIRNYSIGRLHLGSEDQRKEDKIGMRCWNGKTGLSKIRPEGTELRVHTWKRQDTWEDWKEESKPSRKHRCFQLGMEPDSWLHLFSATSELLRNALAPVPSMPSSSFTIWRSASSLIYEIKCRNFNNVLKSSPHMLGNARIMQFWTVSLLHKSRIILKAGLKHCKTQGISGNNSICSWH